LDFWNPDTKDVIHLAATLSDIFDYDLHRTNSVSTPLTSTATFDPYDFQRREIVVFD
jgi:hypothetical protein